MNIVGWIFLALIAVVVLVGLVLILSSVPDIARYRRMRRM
jgi:uncharacterized membrane protein HdeD (DUF308 family)